MKENKNKNKKDKRGLANKGEQILLKLLQANNVDLVSYRKALSFYHKSGRKKARKHAQKFGYPGGLQCSRQAFQEIEDLLFDKHPQYYLSPLN